MENPKEKIDKVPMNQDLLVTEEEEAKEVAVEVEEEEVDEDLEVEVLAMVNRETVVIDHMYPRQVSQVMK